MFEDSTDALRLAEEYKAIQNEQNEPIEEKLEKLFKWYHFTEGECNEVEEKEVLRHHMTAQVFFYERIVRLSSFK